MWPQKLYTQELCSLPTSAPQSAKPLQPAGAAVHTRVWTVHIQCCICSCQAHLCLAERQALALLCHVSLVTP
jgi:hypothetical protein